MRWRILGGLGVCAAEALVASSLFAQTADSAALAAYAERRAARIPWLCVEAGRHAGYRDPATGGPGWYAKAAAELPVGERIGLSGFVDRWENARAEAQYGAGVGANFIWLKQGRLRGSWGPALFGESERVGIMFPLAASWELIPNRLRMEGTVSLRHSLALWSESGSSRTFVTFSVGLGVGLRGEE